jgi:hypothetical protein
MGKDGVFGDQILVVEPHKSLCLGIEKPHDGKMVDQVTNSRIEFRMLQKQIHSSSAVDERLRTNLRSSVRAVGKGGGWVAVGSCAEYWCPTLLAWCYKDKFKQL